LFELWTKMLTGDELARHVLGYAHYVRERAIELIILARNGQLRPYRRMIAVIVTPTRKAANDLLTFAQNVLPSEQNRLLFVWSSEEWLQPTRVRMQMPDGQVEDTDLELLRDPQAILMSASVDRVTGSDRFLERTTEFTRLVDI